MSGNSIPLGGNEYSQRRTSRGLTVTLPEFDGELIIISPKLNWASDKAENKARQGLDLCDNAYSLIDFREAWCV